jgi:uncharacterized protein
MPAPEIIDSLQFARSGQSLQGSVPVAGFKRLEDILYDAQGDLDYELKGGRDARSRPQLELTVRGTPHLQCQRCLGLLEYALEVRTVLLVIAPGASAEEDIDDPEAPDVIEASTELDVATLIEDEVLLSLPLAPRHQEEVCASHGAERARDEVRSAFSRLAAFKNPPPKI